MAPVSKGCIIERVKASRRSVLLLAVLAVIAVIAIVVSRRERGLAPAPLASASAQPRPYRIDVHVHLSATGVPRLKKLMAEYGFDHVVNLSGGHPLDNLPTQIAAARASGGRVTVFAALAYEQAQAPGYGERMAQALRLAHKQGARGLKITKALGLALRGPDGELIPVDDPELDPVFEAAGELGMPVAIHAGDPEAFWLPVDDENARKAELTAHPGWSLYGRDVPSFDEIQKQLGVPFEQAEAYKCGGAADPNDPYRAGMVPQQVVQIIESVSDAIAAEIQRSLDFFMATSGEAEISRIFVTGGTANLSSLAQAVERRARVPTEVWSPVERIMVEAKEVVPNVLQMRAAQLGVALGLSLRKEKESRA